MRRVWRNTVCATGPRCSPPGCVLSRARTYWYARSLRPCLETSIAPRRRAVFHQTLLGDEQPLVLALLPVEGGELCPGEPCLNSRLQSRLVLEPDHERELVDADAEPAAKIGEGPELIELEQPLLAVAARTPGRNDDAGALQVAEHPRRPAGSCGGLADGQRLHRSGP